MVAAVRADEQDRWKRRISNHAAGALLVFTLLHIACFTALAGYTGAGWVNLLGIAILVGMVIPAISRIEARWEAMISAGLNEAERVARFRRERRRLWFAAIVTPFAWSALFLLGHGAIVSLAV